VADHRQPGDGVAGEAAESRLETLFEYWPSPLPGARPDQVGNEEGHGRLAGLRPVGVATGEAGHHDLGEPPGEVAADLVAQGGVSGQVDEDRPGSWQGLHVVVGEDQVVQGESRDKRQARLRQARPLRADAARNRQALLAAARRVFERDGFVTARITDIAEEAGLAHGSFYSHFRSKEDALAAVFGEVEEEMLHPGPSLAGAGADPVAVVHAANAAYLEAYRRNARLMALMEQVATVDERFRELRLERSAAFLARNARAIGGLQRQGLADPALDPDLASLALSTMVSRSAYVALAVGREPVDVGQLAATLTRLWANALRLPDSRQGPGAS